MEQKKCSVPVFCYSGKTPPRLAPGPLFNGQIAHFKDIVIKNFRMGEDIFLVYILFLSINIDTFVR